ncbi:MAG: TonB family protein [Pseudomonadota bacterium]
MRRLLLSAALAIAIHGYLLSTEPAWLNGRPPERPKPPVITMTLTYWLPPRPEPKPPAEPLEIPVKETVSVPKMEKPEPEKPKPVPKPRSVKGVEKEPVKILRPKKKEVKPPKKQTKSEKRAIEPAPRPITASFQPEKEIPTKTVLDVVTPSTPRPPSEESKAEVTKMPSDPWPEIPGDILEEPRSQEKDQIASLPPAQPMLKARPAYKENPRPEYPRLARRRGYQGTTVLEVLVGVTGRVHDIRLLDSSGYEILDNAAAASVREWLFEPGRKGDQRVEMWVRVPVRFELK